MAVLNLSRAKHSWRCFIGFSLGVAALQGAQAQDLYQWEVYDKRVEGARAVEALGNTMFGDNVQLQDGKLSFSATDVDLPSETGLPVRLSRSFRVANSRGEGNNHMLADWTVDVPKISGRFATEWLMDGSTNRCSNTTPPRVPTAVIDAFQLSDFWQGITMDIPGVASGEMLVRQPGTEKPNDGRNYVWTVDGRVQVYCLSNIQNGVGEGFVAVTADGTQYFFDYLAQRGVPGRTAVKRDDAGANLRYNMQIRENILYATQVRDRFNNTVTYSYSTVNGRARLNSISASDGRQLTIGWGTNGFISSVSAGSRTWSYAYGVDNSETGRTTLNRVTLPDASFWKIEFSALSHTPIVTSPTADDRDCFIPDTPQNIAYEPEGAITHPSGARANFKVALELHGADNVTLSCGNVTTTPPSAPAGTGNQPNDDINVFPIAYYDWTLKQKTISGPGIQPQTWTYEYEAHIRPYLYPGVSPEFPVCITPPPGPNNEPPPFNCFKPYCVDDTCAGTARTKVTGPSGNWERYVFGNSWQYNEGKLLRIERGQGSATLETETSVFDLANSLDADPNNDTYPGNDAYPARYGTSLRGDRTGFSAEYHRPQLSHTINRDGVNFAWTVDSTCAGKRRCFDYFARPTNVTRASSLGHSKSEVYQFLDQKGTWTLGLPLSKTVAGLQVARADYFPESHSAKGLMNHFYAFGEAQPQQTLTYQDTGVLNAVKTITDGRNKTTTLSSWFRGVPQNVRYHNNETESAVVNAFGEITKITDENGFSTSFDYDAVGRLRLVSPPTGDSMAWNATTISFVPVQDWEYGIEPGHWRRTETRGTYQKSTYYNARWQPVIEHEYDSNNVSGTQRFKGWRYDNEGRLEFEGYPRSTATSAASFATGVKTEYDGLGRQWRITQSSELGDLPTYYTYLQGFELQVQNPRGIISHTRFQAFDTPDTSLPTYIVQALGRAERVTTAIGRDQFGKPTYITRSGNFGGSNVSATRNYVYDTQQRLCKLIEPESGSTVMDYDAAGNLLWSANGLSLPSASDCDRGSVAAGARVNRSYDDRNRMLTLSFPDGKGNQTFTYTKDGLPETITTQNEPGSQVLNQHQYNKLRLLTWESSSQTGGFAASMIYGYDANGALSSHTYPSGLQVNYAPNALGQATQAGSYATGVTYWPNGAINSFTYGNGIVHELAQNTRGLPDRSTDKYTTAAGAITKFHDDNLIYDANGNVQTILDGVSGSRGNRENIQYDGLDRLTSVSSPMFGVANYSYDPLDNLRTLSINSRNHTYQYNSKQQLEVIRHTGSNTPAFSFSYDVRGNLASKGGLSFQFDYGNRLRRVLGLETYRYDGYGRRVEETHDSLGAIYSFYGQDGVLRYQKDYRTRLSTEHIYIGGSLVARVANALAQ